MLASRAVALVLTIAAVCLPATEVRTAALIALAVMGLESRQRHGYHLVPGTKGRVTAAAF